MKQNSPAESIETKLSHVPAASGELPINNSDASRWSAQRWLRGNTRVWGTNTRADFVEKQKRECSRPLCGLQMKAGQREGTWWEGRWRRRSWSSGSLWSPVTWGGFTRAAQMAGSNLRLHPATPPSLLLVPTPTPPLCFVWYLCTLAPWVWKWCVVTFRMAQPR